MNKKGRMFLATAVAGLFLSVLMTVVVTAARENTNDLDIWWSIKIDELNADGGRSSRFIRANLALKMNLVRYYDVRKARMFIFNLDNERFWINDYRKRAISEGTFGEFYELASRRNDEWVGRIDQAVEQAAGKAGKEKLIEALEERKKLLESASKDFSVLEVKGEAANVGSHPARKMEVSLGGRKIAEVWVAEDIGAPGSWRKFVELASEMEPGMWKVFSAVNGVPLKVGFDYAGIGASWEIRRLSTGGVPASYFLLSKGFEMVEPKL